MKWIRSAPWMANAILILLLAGCGRKSEVPSSAPAAETPLPTPPFVSKCEPGQRGGRLVVAVFGEPKTFNPITANESSSTDILAHLFAGLTRIDVPSQEVLPGLAESWKVEADQKTWTFKLRAGLRWSDGQPLTADDVVFTWNDVIYNPAINNVTRDLFTIDGKPFQVSKVDDLTVRVVTPDIYAPFLEYFGAGVSILPRHVLGKVPAKQFESAFGINTPPTEFVCSGPFRLKEYKPGQHVLVERNPHYYAVDARGQRLPYLDHIIWTTVPDFNAMSLRFLQGESDVQDVIRPDEIDRFEAEARKGKFRVIDLGLQMERGFVWFNQNTGVNTNTGKPFVAPHKLKWFRNTRFRQAISHAMDRPSIIKSVYAGRAIQAAGYISPANKKWYNPDIPKFFFDLPRARALLKEIGIEDRNGDGLLEDAEGNVIEFTLNTNAGNTVREKIAVLLQADFKQLGIRLNFQPLDFNTLVDKINGTYEYDCILLTFGADGTDPTGLINSLKSDGFTHAWFPRQKTPSTEWEARIDFLVNAQLKTLDFAERKKYFDEVQHILAEQLPMIPVVLPNAVVAARADLGNLRPSQLSTLRTLWNSDELYFRK
ncbi:MAG TPA: ABC transporter substrate-binding protein [Methylomirabilota bacterium]|nr:ABC transporter substrate-binding protein [Methylomirabilota bacterium]